jgi:hypothetical protein
MEKFQMNREQHPDGSTTYSYRYKPDKEKSFLEQEEDIAEITTAMGRAITEQLLSSHDTYGEALQVHGRRLTSKGLQKKRTTRLTAK